MNEGEGHNAIVGIVALATHIIPNCDCDFQLLKGIQRLAHMLAIGNAGLSLHPIPDPKLLIFRVIGIDVCFAVARWCQTCDQRSLGGMACPCQPAEVARLGAVKDVDKRFTRCCIGNRFYMEGDGEEFTGSIRIPTP
jgi:hypothetical protein